jgi:chorismate dehydratase
LSWRFTETPYKYWFTLKSVRVGCVKYLNAGPLIRGWPGSVEFDHPSALCRRLAAGQLDVALVSSFEFLRNPIYRIVDDVSISSDGPVYSVVVAHRDEFSNIEDIELDPASETAVNLLRCLLAELGLTPRLTRGVPEGARLQSATGRIRRGEPAVGGKVPTTPRARLIIGDQAISFRRHHAGTCQFWDLGEQWKKLSGLPFVYALWLIRPEVPDAKSIAQCLRGLRDENLADLPGVVADAAAEVADNKRAITREFIDRYYHEHLRFGFGVREKQGLQSFADFCAKHGVLPKRARELSLV